MLLLSRMWKGLYSHLEKATPPRQSPADFLSAVREESQQLEEELTNQQEVPAGGTAHHSKQGIQHTNAPLTRTLSFSMGNSQKPAAGPGPGFQNKVQFVLAVKKYLDG